jgi:stalled ribosome rescue protein Dom34
MGDKIEKHKFFDKREKKRIKSRRTELKNLHLQIRIYGLNWKKEDKTLTKRIRTKIKTKNTESKLKKG